MTHVASLPHVASLNFMGDCNKCGQLILRKIIKTVATRCHILRLKCTKFDFVWGSAELTALPRPPSWIQGVLLLRGEGNGGRKGEEAKRGRGGRGKGRVASWLLVG